MRAAIVGWVAAVLGSRVAAQTPAWQDLALPFERRAADLVARMTLEEKVSQMMDRAPAIDRLGVLEYNWWNEGLHGVARTVTFPLAASALRYWDPGAHRWTVENGPVVVEVDASSADLRARRTLTVRGQR